MSVIIHQNINKWQTTGRLGNQMFRIASMIGIAKRNGVPYYLDTEWDYQKYFTIHLPIRSNRTYNQIRDQLPYYHYEDVILDRNSVYGIEAYLQSEKYFEACKDYIKELFTLKVEYSDPLQETFRDHLSKIAMHVRRTDYVGNGATPALPLEYYSDALSYFPDEEILICSDDIAWCKQNFLGDRFYFQDMPQADILDLYLMSYCKGIIIANSAFSWWSAWLGERDGYKIVAPNLWFGGWESRDIIPDRWNRIGRENW